MGKSFCRRWHSICACSSPILAEVELVTGFLTSAPSPVSPAQGGLCTGQLGKLRLSLRLVGLARQLREVKEQWS